MSLHTIYLPELAAHPGGRLLLTGDEAHHAARVKRLGVGDAVRLVDGRGRTASAAVSGSRRSARAGWELELDVRDITAVPRPTPQLRVLASAPKGDRLAQMIDGLSQVGAASWSNLITPRTVVEPRQGKLDRLDRVALESMKQCARAWTLDILPPTEFQGALQSPGGPVVVADAGGADYRPSGAGMITLLIGPEGGWAPDELDAARRAGAVLARFGAYTMRTEVAAVVASAGILSVEPRRV